MPTNSEKVRLLEKTGSDRRAIKVTRLTPERTFLCRRWHRADYTDWLGKPHDAGAFRGEVRWQIAARPVNSLLTNAA